MDTMTWAPIEQGESSTSRPRFDFGLRSANFRFNDVACTRVGGRLFLPTHEIKQTSGACQGGCRLGHAAKGWVSMLLRCAVMTESRSGLSVTIAM